MRKLTGWLRLALLLASVGLIAACGQTGDLYLPEGTAYLVLLG